MKGIGEVEKASFLRAHESAADGETASRTRADRYKRRVERPALLARLSSRRLSILRVPGSRARLGSTRGNFLARVTPFKRDGTRTAVVIAQILSSTLAPARRGGGARGRNFPKPRSVVRTSRSVVLENPETRADLGAKLSSKG